MDDVLKLSQRLIAIPSITPENLGCLELIAEKLMHLGMDCERLDFSDVKNLIALQPGSGPVFLFCGHIDVVPPGNEQLWTSPPFNPEIRDSKLFGRGVVDMKCAVAAMVCSAQKVLPLLQASKQSEQDPNNSVRLGFLITSDEEGEAEYGVKKIVEILKGRKIDIPWCLIGEPSSENSAGDQIRVGRRGSLNAIATVKGKQGHVAYPEKCLNPIHKAAAIMRNLNKEILDNGSGKFPPSTLQITNIHSGEGVHNVVPEEVIFWFNIRFNPTYSIESLQAKIHSIFAKTNTDYAIEWLPGANPFASVPGSLTSAVDLSIKKIQNFEPEHSTAGGTSDGRFLTSICPEIIELGLNNGTAHKIDECCKVSEIIALEKIYEDILLHMLTLSHSEP